MRPGSMAWLRIPAILLLMVMFSSKGCHSSPCTDRHPNCPALHGAGYCHWSVWTKDYVLWTRKYCRKSCGLCHCANVYASCVNWATNHYCSKKGSMWTYCPTSCGLCGCTDGNRRCHKWAKDGWCLRRPSYMLQHCRKSCNACGCKDLYSSCGRWRKQGHCKRSVTFMRVYCRKTCHYCGAKPITVTPRKKTSEINGQGCGKSLIKRVVGGEESKPGKYPWMVGIVRKEESQKVICGASLITDGWVLSAAHCFVKKGGKIPSNYLLRLGEHHIRKKEVFEKTVAVSKIILHPDFVQQTFDNDIALLKLAKPVTFARNIAPICLPAPKYKFVPGKNCIISGWGAKMEDSEGAVELHEAKVPLIDHNKCNDAFSKIRQSITRNMICAGHVKGGIDTCRGDSGGPLVCPKASGGGYEQVGIVSWGYGCARKGLYGVYTNLKLYRQWIESTMKS